MFDINEVLFDFVGKQVTKVDGSSYVAELEHGTKYLIDFRHNKQFFLAISDRPIHFVNTPYYGVILIVRDKFSKEIAYSSEFLASGHYLILCDKVGEEYISPVGKKGDMICLDIFNDHHKLYRHIQYRYFDKWLDEREKWNLHFQEFKEKKPAIRYENEEVLID